MSDTQIAIDAVRLLEVLENENIALQAMLEKCNSKFIVGLEAENAALREEVATIRAATIEECAKVCVDRAKDWEDSVNEGSEQMAYETKVLYDAAAEIRALLTTGEKK